MRRTSTFEATCHICGKLMTGETPELQCCVPVRAEWPCVTKLDPSGKVTG